jgi:hypothetical protein
MLDEYGEVDPDKVLRSDGVELIRAEGSEYWADYEAFLADGGVVTTHMDDTAWQRLGDIGRMRLRYAQL